MRRRRRERVPERPVRGRLPLRAAVGRAARPGARDLRREHRSGTPPSPRATSPRAAPRAPRASTSSASRSRRRTRAPPTSSLGNPGCPSPCSAHPLEVCANPEFVCSPAGGHNHAALQQLRALRAPRPDAGQAVVVGHKQGFCLRDSVACATPHYTCDNQGISAGCDGRLQRRPSAASTSTSPASRAAATRCA